MNKLTSAVAAIALGAATVAATAGGAAADGKWKGPKGPQHHYHHYHSGPGPGAIAGAAILGMAIGAMAAPLFDPYPYPYAYYPPPPPPPPIPVYPNYAYNPHIAWCFGQYGDAYNPATNQWTDMWGVTRVCVPH
jgi:hypothetical protein